MSRKPVIDELLNIRSNPDLSNIGTETVWYNGIEYNYPDIVEPDPKWIRPHLRVKGEPIGIGDDSAVYEPGYRVIELITNKRRKIELDKLGDEHFALFDHPYVIREHQMRFYNKTLKTTVYAPDGTRWSTKGLYYLPFQRFLSDPCGYFLHENDQKYIHAIELKTGKVDRKISVGGYPLKDTNRVFSGNGFVHRDSNKLVKIENGRKVAEWDSKSLLYLKPLDNGLFVLSEGNYDTYDFDIDDYTTIYNFDLGWERQYGHGAIEYSCSQGHVICKDHNKERTKVFLDDLLVADFPNLFSVASVSPMILVDHMGQAFSFTDDDAASVGKIAIGKVMPIEAAAHVKQLYFAVHNTVNYALRYYNMEDFKL